MQNRYVGDIGDYLKLGILRALSPRHRLGVAWWLYTDESHNRDGGHIGYLQRPEQWRHFNSGLFDALAGIVATKQRHVRALEAANILPDAIFASLEPTGYSHGSAQAGKSVLLSELRELARPERCLIVYHHHTRRKGGHHSEIEYWSERLRAAGFATVDALRAKPYSPRVYFLLDAPADIRLGRSRWSLIGNDGSRGIPINP